jgi:hypothetical protein
MTPQLKSSPGVADEGDDAGFEELGGGTDFARSPLWIRYPGP